MRDRWEDNTPYIQCQIMAYHQRCMYEEDRRDAEMARASIGHMAGGKAKGKKR